jgi:hypothetical protein
LIGILVEAVDFWGQLYPYPCHLDYFRVHLDLVGVPSDRENHRIRRHLYQSQSWCIYSLSNLLVITMNGTMKLAERR